MEKRTIILVDDHVIVRNGLKELIEKLGDFSVVDQFDSASALLNVLPLVPQPDLAIIDLNMPGMNGDELIKTLKESGNELPVLILTLDSDEQTIIRLFRNGVRGFLKKNCSAEILKNALESIFTSGYYHNEFLAQLTDRERSFLRLVCHEKEYTYEQIADQLSVTPRTVDGYREAIFDKFAIKSKTGLVLFVLKHRLLELL